jgi:multidrug efflux pump subunit AcrB
MKGRLKNADEFENIIVKSGADGRVVRLKDIARVELGALSYNAQGYADKYPAVIVVVDQQPGTNAVRATQGIKDVMAELSKSFPKGLEYRITYNRSARFTPPSSRPLCWWCWWCCCSSRPGAPP